MKFTLQPIAPLVALLALSSCNPESKEESKASAPVVQQDGLLQVGSITIHPADLDHHLTESHGRRRDEATRSEALDELANRARFAQAALDAGLDRDPVVRSEIARILASRLRERELFPRLKELAAPLPEARLRELYAADQSSFRAPEKRQVAVLWLNPSGNPERDKEYRDKLATAREWLFNNGDLKDHPDQGFSVLGVDYSEHAASRFKGGIVGWLERGGGLDAWSKALAGIAFSLEEAGQVSEVVSCPEGVFLVRCMAVQEAVQRPFEAVAAEIDRKERQRLREQAEAAFEEAIKAKYPVQLRAPAP